MENKDKAEDKYSLKYLAFYYLKTKDKIDFQGVDFKEINNTNGWSDEKIVELSNYKEILDVEYKKINNDFKCIFEIFQVCQYMDAWKEDKQYVFSSNEVDIFSEFLYRYHNSKEWKIFKKVNNKNQDGFVKLYQENLNANIAEELEFVVTSFLEMYEKKYPKDLERVEEFKNNIYVYTQYHQIMWINDMKEILFSIPGITMEDIVRTKAGCLIGEYDFWLREMKVTVSQTIIAKRMAWRRIKRKLQQEFIENCINSEELNVAIMEFLKYVNKEGGELADIINENFGITKNGLNQLKNFFDESEIQNYEVFEKVNDPLINEFIDYLLKGEEDEIKKIL